MIAQWPWGNYWEDPDWEALAPEHPMVPDVDDPDPGDSSLLGPDGKPLPPRPRHPVGFTLPTEETP